MAPLLVGCASVAAQRWNPRIGGAISALPAVVGPVLLITAQDRGAIFAARAANGTLLGLAALGAFVLAYSAVAQRARWGLSLCVGWSFAALASALTGWLAGGLGLLGGLAVATVSLILASAALPDAHPTAAVTPLPAHGPRELQVRMALTAVLVALLVMGGELFGATVGGLLTALPVLASVLAVFTHRRDGSFAAIALLRGMIGGMTGFVGFCAVVSLLIVPAGTAAAFAAAAATAVGAQVLTLNRGRRRAFSPRAARYPRASTEAHSSTTPPVALAHLPTACAEPRAGSRRSHLLSPGARLHQVASARFRA